MAAENLAVEATGAEESAMVAMATPQEMPLPQVKRVAVALARTVGIIVLLAVTFGPLVAYLVMR